MCVIHCYGTVELYENGFWHFSVIFYQLWIINTAPIHTSIRQQIKAISPTIHQQINPLNVKCARSKSSIKPTTQNSTIYISLIHFLAEGFPRCTNKEIHLDCFSIRFCFPHNSNTYNWWFSTVTCKDVIHSV